MLNDSPMGKGIPFVVIFTLPPQKSRPPSCGNILEKQSAGAVKITLFLKKEHYLKKLKKQLNTG